MRRNLEMLPPPESDSAGSTKQITSLTFTTNVPPPGRLELKGNLSKNWKKWRQVWDIYETITKLNEMESRFRVVGDFHHLHWPRCARSTQWPAFSLWWGKTRHKCRFESMEVPLYWTHKCYLRTLQVQQSQTRASRINRCTRVICMQWKFTTPDLLASLSALLIEVLSINILLFLDQAIEFVDQHVPEKL